MPISTRFKLSFFQLLKNIFFLSLVLSSCVIAKKYQKDKPFVVKNSIEVKGGYFTKDEKSALKARLNAQLDDSSKVNVVDKYFIRHVYNSPPAFDTASAAKSARNMKASMLHLGYYRAKVDYKADTVKKNKKQRVTVHYIVTPGKPTLIDTISYRLKRTDIQELTMQNMDKTLLEENKPVTKAAVLGEISRLVDLYRNNGYYKITSEELKMRGDTSLEALTSISDDPFEQLRLLAEAQQGKDSPKIKLGLVLNPPADSNRLKKYYINNVYILPDYRPGDKLNDSSLTERVTKELHIVRYHYKMIRSAFLSRNMYLKKGDLYRQADFYKTLNSFSRSGVWQSTNIEIVEVKDGDSINKINLIVQLAPAKQLSFETSAEASYSANSNTNNVTTANAGNLLGLSGNVALTNRNLGREGIKMTTGLRAGVELNLRRDTSTTKNIINSNEITFSNTIVFPRFILVPKRVANSKRILSPETFSNFNLSSINRINLFKLQSINLSIGYTWRNRKNAQWLYKPLNVEFTRLFNESQQFIQTLDTTPFLRYSFNTALVAGSNFGFTYSFGNRKHTNQQNNFKINIEESGVPILPLFVLRKLPVPVPIPFLLRQWGIGKKYLRQYLKADIEYTHSRTFKKSALAFRFFSGVGIASKKDTTLPFFKQYFGGGSNSMRGWPVRGIGRGAQPLAPFGNNTFNDRTGDIQLEANLEFRHVILQIIPNSFYLRGALFADVGNIWNLRNAKPSGGLDSAQFKFKNMLKETGINAGYGFRFDFNNIIIRFDFGFRFKRPELSGENNGWKVPALSFNDALQKIFTRGKNDEYRKWRYENFNFTIGINYPF
jgi:outer membrane protein insertion porin family